MSVPSMPKRERIFSLDLLRGLDIFLLTAIGPLVWAIHRTWGDYENPAWWLDQVKHPAFGFSVWDVIMPLFLFMSGAAVPLVRGIPHLIGQKYQEMFLWAAMIAIQTWFLYLWRKARKV